MLDKLIALRIFVSLVFSLLLFGFFIVGTIKGVFRKEALPYMVIASLLSIVVILGIAVFFYM